MIDELILFSDNDFWKLINDHHASRGGAYKIIAVKDGKRVPIRRFLGMVDNGVLYIGKATSFVDRVINLKKSISPDYNGTAHICGRRYKANGNIEKQFPYEQLHIELIPSDDPEQLERELLNEYKFIFGEVPPLNAI